MSTAASTTPPASAASASASARADARPSSAPRVPERLDELLELDAPALRALYEAASVPRLQDVEGDLRGRMLAIPAVKGPVARLIRRWAGSRRFPWLGKSFTPEGAERGHGLNRILSDRLKLFRFETFIGRSRAGDFDALQLDYDDPKNPFFIRAIKDEIRELRPGLYLGQAWIQVGERAPVLGLYFGLERAARPN
jgi:hypothetical protein